VVAARLQGHEHRGPLRPWAGDSEGLDLSMGLTEPPVPSLADDLRPLNDDAPNHRVGLHVPLPEHRKLQRPSHVPAIQFRLLHDAHHNVRD
jgi:hypothetical protein